MPYIKPLFIALILISSCKPSQDACIEQTEAYYLPDTRYSWFDKVTPPGANSDTLTFISNTGLTEQITVVKDTGKYLAYVTDCEKQVFNGSRCWYTSSSGQSLFQLHISWQYNWYPGYLSTVQTYDVVDKNKIDLWLYFVSEDSAYGTGVKLSQPIIPIQSNMLKTTRYVSSTPHRDGSVNFCDTCITSPGTYSQNGKTYTDVSFYSSSEPKGYSKFIVDRNYGVIGFIKNGVGWTLQ